MPYVHPVQIYYEDTDHSGVVYHANYLKYFERAREHLLGVDELVRLWEEEGIGFVVYQVRVKFREGARHGRTYEIRTSLKQGSPFRAIFTQQVWEPGGSSWMVDGEVELCCVDREGKLVQLPGSVQTLIATVLSEPA
ncbi:MAG TPA: YbgC/FadM family acyl-CoA thioesterase [Myxococcota bacterium]|nr:YbgC/FadM family acyl-CoA thioesterase [Myxococcota bacterium]